MATASDTYRPHPFTHDLYAPLGHIIGGGHGPNGQDRPPGSPQWVDHVDARRLAAYRVLAAMCDNARRYYLPPQMWSRDPADAHAPDGSIRVPLSAAERWREYGRADVLVDTARSLVLGESQGWVIEDPDHSGATTDPAAAAAGDQATGTAWEAARDWINTWSKDERVWSKVHAAERNTVALGDGVYALGWSPAKSRPRLRTYNPGFYFPDPDAPTAPTYVQAGWDDDDFPPVVHIAWEEERPAGSGDHYLRRETWQLLPAEAWTTPWGKPALWRCWHSVDLWRVDALRTTDTVYNLPLPGTDTTGLRQGHTVLTPATDLGIDFIPVVHVPNDTAALEHGFGRSLLLRLAQILDDLAADDTDLAENASLVGSPTLVMTGGATPGVPAGPGTQVGLPIGADASYLDTSKTLDALLKHRTELVDELLSNARIVPSVMGKVDPGRVPSGYALRLSFASTEALVREMRALRADKLPLIPKMAARLAIAAGALTIPGGGDVPAVDVDFGAALPADRASAVVEVTGLLEKGAISVRTAVKMLMAVGIPVEDLDEELREIAEDAASGRADAAVAAVTALGEAEGVPVARRFLASDGTTDPVPPAPALPGVPPLPGPGTVGEPTTGAGQGPEATPAPPAPLP